MSLQARQFFDEEEHRRILEAIRDAELNTSGEIRVHVENRCKDNVLDRAAYLFRKLGMHRTGLRNGVLFYLSVDDHKFAILGDAGINQKVPSDFWDNISDRMASRFGEGRFADGLTEGILDAGKQLKQHFPYQQNDVNELSNDISFPKT